ncbi:uncharacterized protein F5891DRAFT_982728 [Suillus fuscotomentosus]|uniref:Uncharacterized protein n=1 Tax=Suillus fuscotomentosus TaxID=1912939 RepID=A0AAD4E084_9AGAM|nr:uncharacterized protein F5891DRAFT_982728 [Suillus fuscotomentosus]KAG1897339.1 hypothetical protein F5891DRAFT_982728 [Suillus fuscotomentosus]
MASSSHHNPQIGTPALFDSFIFESIGLMPLYGDFVGVDDVDFMAYLALGHGPALYPLYTSSSLEVTQSKEVPVYVSSYIASDTVMSDDIGHAYRSNDATFTSTSDSVGHAIISNEYIASDTMMSGDVVRAYRSNDAVMTDTHYGDRHMTSEDLTSDNTSEVVMSNSPTIYSWISYSANMTDNGAPSVCQSRADRRHTRTKSNKKKAEKSAKSEKSAKPEQSAKPEKPAPSEMGLKSVMKKYPGWKVAFAHLRSLLRIAVCLGRVGNPHLLNFERKADAIRDTWPQALLLANIRADDLEEVASLTSSTPMSHENVLKLANPSLSEFIYDARHLALCTIGHSHAGFGFDDVPAGVLLLDLVQGVLQQFMRPKSNRFPIKDNGFAWFFGCQIAKEIMWHIIFRSSPTHGVRLVLADMEPATFRNVDHPPFPTMSLLGSSCYSAVLEKYSDLTNIPVDLLTQYPATEDVYDQLCETAVELVGQSDDEDHPKLMTDLSNLCRIVIDDVYRLGRPSKKSCLGMRIDIH